MKSEGKERGGRKEREREAATEEDRLQGPRAAGPDGVGIAVWGSQKERGGERDSERRSAGGRRREWEAEGLRRGEAEGEKTPGGEKREREEEGALEEERRDSGPYRGRVIEGDR